MSKRDEMREAVEETAGIEFIYNGKKINLEKDKTNNRYTIKCGRTIRIFKSYEKAVNFNIIESPYNLWLTLNDVNKIMEYSQKIHEIELKGLVEGRDICIDNEDDLKGTVV